MRAENNLAGEDASGGGKFPFLEPLRAALSKIDEPDRYRLLASLFGKLADQSQAGADGQQRAQVAQIEALSKKIQALNEDKAAFNDTLAATKADLERRESQCEAEQTRAAELQRIVDEQRERLELLKKNVEDTDSQLKARNEELHEAQVENENLLLKLQRTEAAADSSGMVASLEAGKGELAVEVERLRGDLEQVRADRDTEIERLTAELQKSGSQAGEGGETLLGGLWQRLASAKPPLVDGPGQPDKKAAERLVDTVIELVTLAAEMEKMIGPFLGKYTKPRSSIKVPWDVYLKREDVFTTAQKTLQAKGGKPVGLLKMRLRFLYRWTAAGMGACDAVIENVASELQTHLLTSEMGAGSDPNRKIRDYIRADGHELFLQRMRELLSEILGEDLRSRRAVTKRED